MGSFKGILHSCFHNGKKHFIMHINNKKYSKLVGGFRGGIIMASQSIQNVLRSHKIFLDTLFS